ncbi:hypothetical protein BU17DRAFT_43876 [Hysterangium stoloniferum]|nr:hypothetical protein BU17DRAFT_43876 [Hysterangium stoloniferum]
MRENDVRADILDAYSRLDLHQLQIFLRIRSLPITGSPYELATRLTEHDLKTYSPIEVAFSHSISPPSVSPVPSRTPSLPVYSPSSPGPRLLSALPIDIVSEILDHIGSWELSKSVGVPTSLPTPLEWNTSATSLDRAILSSSLSVVRSTPTSPPFTRLGAELLIIFELVDILNHLWGVDSLRPIFKKYYGESFAKIPTLACSHNRSRILDWWLSEPSITPKHYTSEAIDIACRNLALDVLEWWDVNSRSEKIPALSFPPLYTSLALESASLKAHIPILTFFSTHSWPFMPGRSLDMASAAGHTAILNWWAFDSGLELGKDVKYDKNAVYHASCGGKVEVLQWWKEQSERSPGVQMLFDGDALVGATRHNKPKVLTWWNNSGLPISYRMCDIEEALEDSIGGGVAVRAWWARKGVNFRAGDSEWMRVRSLN